MQCGQSSNSLRALIFSPRGGRPRVCELAIRRRHLLLTFDRRRRDRGAEKAQRPCLPEGHHDISMGTRGERRRSEDGLGGQGERNLLFARDRFYCAREYGAERINRIWFRVRHRRKQWQRFCVFIAGVIPRCGEEARELFGCAAGGNPIDDVTLFRQAGELKEADTPRDGHQACSNRINVVAPRGVVIR